MPDPEAESENAEHDRLRKMVDGAPLGPPDGARPTILRHYKTIRSPLYYLIAAIAQSDL